MNANTVITAWKLLHDIANGNDISDMTIVTLPIPAVIITFKCSKEEVSTIE